MNELIEKVEAWAVEKGLDNNELWSKQFAKIVEELGELSSSILKEKREEERDAFGDLLVTIIILALQRDIHLTSCLFDAYEVIKNRQGKLVNGSFIKEENS